MILCESEETEAPGPRMGVEEGQRGLGGGRAPPAPAAQAPGTWKPSGGCHEGSCVWEAVPVAGLLTDSKPPEVTRLGAAL